MTVIRCDVRRQRADYLHVQALRGGYLVGSGSTCPVHRTISSGSDSGIQADKARSENLNVRIEGNEVCAGRETQRGIVVNHVDNADVALTGSGRDTDTRDVLGKGLRSRFVQECCLAAFELFAVLNASAAAVTLGKPPD